MHRTSHTMSAAEHVAGGSATGNAPAPGAPAPREESAQCRRILVASCHGDVELAPAIRAASALGALHHAAVTVTVAFEPNVPYPGASDINAPVAVTRRVAPDDREEADERLARVRQELAGGAGGESSWPVTLEVGQAAVAIVRAAQREGANIIVLPLPRGARRGMRSTDGGAATVALYASIPVFAVSPALARLPTRVLLAVGLDPSIVDAARICRALLPPLEEVHLIHVAGAELAHPELVTEQFDRVEAVLDPPDGCRVVRRVIRGQDPWRSLLASASRRRVAAIVAGLHGRTSIDRTLVRNTALRILASARRSTLVVPSETARDCVVGRAE